MEQLWQDNKDAGLMVITVLAHDSNMNIPDADDCAEWGDAYGATHPILGDLEGFADAVMQDGSGFPFSLLVDRGMVVTTMDSGTRSISEAEMQELL